jgi:hypothetical protein
MKNYKQVNSKNLKKGVMYFIEKKNKESIAAYFDKDESVKYLRFKNASNEPLLISKNSKFYYPHKNSSTRKNNNNNNGTRKYNRPKRVEFEPTSVIS